MEQQVARLRQASVVFQHEQHRRCPGSRAPGWLVGQVTYHNPDNGYCVLRVKVRGHRDLVTVLGHAASISAGEFVQASGKWEVHREHGQQFQDAVLKSARLASLEGMEKYLGSRLIEDIGPDYTKKLVSTRRVLCSTLSAGRAAD